MKYRIKTNLVEILNKYNYDLSNGLEDFLINQVIEEISILADSLGFDREKFLVGNVDSPLIYGKFIIPREAVELLPVFPFGEIKN